ncbi:MAG TPA: hypothetical protein PLV25_08135, partial [Opitutales bacterium]|nr:hypothetical protein [Opitutales bacterium]
MNPKDTHHNITPISEVLQTPLAAEDRLWLFWQRNKNTAYACILAIVVGVGSVQFWQNHQRNSLLKMQAGFLETTSTNEWAAFAQEYDKAPLGALGALREADEAWINSDFEKALSTYQASAKALKHTPLYGRTQIGEAMCLEQMGKQSEATAQLTAILANSTLLETANFSVILFEF